MTNAELEPPRDTPPLTIDAVPAMPILQSGEMYRGSAFTLVEGRRYGLGWQDWPAEKGGPGFVTVKRGLLGFLKVKKRYPLTDEGWAQAWRAFAKLDQNAAQLALDVLASRPRPPGQAWLDPRVVDYRSFHADPAVISKGSVSIPVGAVTGWTAKLTMLDSRTGPLSSVLAGSVPIGSAKTTRFFFRVVSPDHSIELFLEASGVSLRERVGHADLELLNRRLQDYGAKIINPVLVPQLCQQAIAGQLKIGLLTLSQLGLSKQGVFRVRRIAWPDYFSSDTSNGRVLLYRRKTPGSSKRKRRPWCDVDLSQTNAIVLPPVLADLNRYFNPT
jgi:hypothetical protein